MDDRTERLKALLQQVTALRATVAAARTDQSRWKPLIGRVEFAASSLNLAQYLALRRVDLRDMQRELAIFGLSSLGRSEGHVLATLDAVLWALARMAGEGPGRACADRRFLRGPERLRLNTDTLFGPPQPGRAGRIMVTLGLEAADEPGLIADLARQGADVVRINCGHDDPAVWARMIGNVRAAAAVRPMRVLMDIAGPKVRTAEVLTPHHGNRLHVGDDLLLCREIGAGHKDHPFQATCAPASVLDRLKPGDFVSLDDGKLSGTITGESDLGFAVTFTAGRLKGVKLTPQRGLNFPGVDLQLDPLTAKDRTDLDFVARNADLVGLSFVQTAGHVEALQAELAARRPDWQRLGLVAKIETPMAVRNLPEIIVQAAGRQPLAVMIARGDLAVEIGFERVAEIQQEILWLCEAAQIPAIWATQVLEGLVQEGLPTRSEMTDAASATQAECVMLNKGPNLAAGVAALDRMYRTMGENQDKKTPILRALRSWPAEGGAEAG